MKDKILKIIGDCEDEVYAQEEASPEEVTAQILSLICEEIEKVENPNKIEKAEYMITWTAHTAFEQCRQKILALLRK